MRAVCCVEHNQGRNEEVVSVCLLKSGTLLWKLLFVLLAWFLLSLFEVVFVLCV